jgi:hypothetical protein
MPDFFLGATRAELDQAAAMLDAAVAAITWEARTLDIPLLDGTVVSVEAWCVGGLAVHRVPWKLCPGLWGVTHLASLRSLADVYWNEQGARWTVVGALAGPIDWTLDREALAQLPDEVHREAWRLMCEAGFPNQNSQWWRSKANPDTIVSR